MPIISAVERGYPQGEGRMIFDSRELWTFQTIDDIGMVTMTDPGKYGKGPYRIAVIHGGPGAAGYMAPVARYVSRHRGTLEPYQTKRTIAGQIEELADVLNEHGALPVVLIGHSWGAFLSFIFAVRHPTLVRKIILVGCPPFEERYAAGIDETRLARLDAANRKKLTALQAALSDPDQMSKNVIFSRFGRLMSLVDSVALIPGGGKNELADVVYDFEIHRQVWGEAGKLRETGELLNMAKNIRCPVIAVHGDRDPHPLEGVREPLERTLREFRITVLKDCGHYPWLELGAVEAFYGLLSEELI